MFLSHRKSFVVPRLLGIAFLLFAHNLMAADSKPNVLLISIDDLKPTLGCYGDATAKTPHIDALAQRSMRFDSAYCNQAVCAPSRHSLMLGLRPQTLGIYDLATKFREVRPDAITLGQAFQNAGYSSIGMGKIYHTGYGNSEDDATWSEPHFKPRRPTYVEKANQEALIEINGMNRGPSTERTEQGDGAYRDGKTADEAVRRIKQFASDTQQPFFLAVGFSKPHLPFCAPAKYWDLYNPDDLPMPEVKSLPEGAPRIARTGFGELRNYTDIPAKGVIDEDLTRHLIHGYYAATSYVDAQVARVVEALDKSGLAENTIIVLWGDHGWHLGDHGMWCKHTNYEQAARIPFLVHVPGGPTGSTNAMVETVDIFPTLGELVDMPIPNNLDGESFASVLRDPDAQARPYITHVFPRGEILGVAVRDKRYRLVHWQSADGETTEIELYDYDEDPSETKNIADSNKEIVDQMSAWIDSQPKPLKQYKRPKSTMEK